MLFAFQNREATVRTPVVHIRHIRSVALQLQAVSAPYFAAVAKEISRQKAHRAGLSMKDHWTALLATHR